MIRYSMLVAACSSLLACADQPTFPGPIADRDLFVDMGLNHRAVNLALVPPYDTVTLKATPRNALGEILQTDVQPQVTVLSDHLVVLPNGVIRAQRQTSASGVMVIASMSVGGVTQSDTAYIVVTNVPVPQRPGSLSIPIPEPDRTIPLAHLYFDPVAIVLPVRVTDSSGLAVPRAIAHFSMQGSPIGLFLSTNGASATFAGIETGTTTIHASALVYGVAMSDSITITVVNPRVSVMWMRSTTSMVREVRVSAGGEVFWIHAISDTLDLVFDTPEVVSAPCCNRLAAFDQTQGNIAPFMRDPSLPVNLNFSGYPRTGMDNVRGRRFMTPGRYPYRSTRIPDIWGTIIVE